MTLRRWLALCGVAWPVITVLAFTVVGGTDTPEDDASAAKVISYYNDHKAAGMIAALLVAIGAVLLVLFAAQLREELLGDGNGNGVLANAAFGGALVLAGGLLFLASVHFALIQAVDHKFEGPAQTLNVLDSNDFFAMVGGIAVALLAAGIAIVRVPVLPRWLGWVAIVIGVAALAGPIGFFAAILAVVWFLVVAILMLVRTNVTAATVQT